jgi:hypothetical protein
MDDLDSLNRRLHKGAVSEALYLGFLFLGMIVVVAWGISTGDLSADDPWTRWILIPLTLVLTMEISLLRAAFMTIATQLDRERLVRRSWRGARTVRWADVTRVSPKWRRVVLEQQGGTRTVLSLRHTEDPDELYRAICNLVPLRAFDEAGA